MVILLLLFLPTLRGNIKVDLHYWLRNIFGVNTFCSTLHNPLSAVVHCVHINFIYLYISNFINSMGVTFLHSSPYNDVMMYKNKQLNLFKSNYKLLSVINLLDICHQYFISSPEMLSFKTKKAFCKFHYWIQSFQNKKYFNMVVDKKRSFELEIMQILWPKLTKKNLKWHREKIMKLCKFHLSQSLSHLML